MLWTARIRFHDQLALYDLSTAGGKGLMLLVA